MRAALRGTYTEYAHFNSISDRYPDWLVDELYDSIFSNESSYSFWSPEGDREVEYYDKTLIADYSVFLRNSSGHIHVTTYDAFIELYDIFTYDSFTNSGLVALKEDSIEFVECKAGVIPAGYPSWFYEYFTEAVNFPQEPETIFINDRFDISVDDRCIFLRNKFGEVRYMEYESFIKQYDPDPNGEIQWASIQRW